MRQRISSMSFAHDAEPAALKVLYIDDNPLDLLAYSAALKQSSDAIDLRTATDLDQGVALLHEWDADAIVLDLSLPGSEGLETLQLLRRSVVDIPVVILSGSHSEELVLSLVEHGAQEFLAKGEVREGELLRSIRLAMIREEKGRGEGAETRLSEDMPALPSSSSTALMPVAEKASADRYSNGTMASSTSSYFITGELDSGVRLI